MFSMVISEPRCRDDRSACIIMHIANFYRRALGLTAGRTDYIC